MAYRFLLDRDPENDEVIANFLSVKSIHELRNIFFNSEEFDQKL